VFAQFVREKNFPEIKKFMDHYVEKVVVFHNHIELTLKVVVDLHGGGGTWFTHPQTRRKNSCNSLGIQLNGIFL
jgi:hypothetical protein